MSPGNRAEILLNGDEIFPVQLAAIRAAQATITYAQYSVSEGRSVPAIVAALADRCRAGVRVSVLLVHDLL